MGLATVSAPTEAALNGAVDFLIRLFLVYSWSLSTTSTTKPLTISQQLAKPLHLTGFVALLAADALFVFSLSWMRQRFHGTFKLLHVLGVIVLFISVRSVPIGHKSHRLTAH
jgi:hypothetical protein